MDFLPDNRGRRSECLGWHTVRVNLKCCLIWIEDDFKGARENNAEPIIVQGAEAGAAAGQSFEIHEWSGSGPDYLAEGMNEIP